MQPDNPTVCECHHTHRCAIARSSIGRAILQIVACATTGPVGCAAAGAALTLAAGGSIKQALIGAAISFVQIGAYSGIHQIIGGIADRPLSAAVKIGLHAVVGGAVSVAQGGSFETGALTGAVAAGSSLLMDSSGAMGHSGDGNPEYIAERTAVAAVAGGTASVLSGGKFANGAITGAFAQLYNADAAALAKAATRGFAVRFTATAATAATIAAMDGPLPVGDIIGGGLLIYDAVTTVYGYIFNSDAPDLPTEVTGENGDRQGGRINTDLPADRFPGVVDALTGGNLVADVKRPGHLVAPNGVRIRPTAEGPRVDIPASGARPHETIHFPPETNWPW
ncbi:MAG: hypothetical protein R3D51_17835 [Hyphomicrobiaceae bacterium]